MTPHDFDHELGTHVERALHQRARNIPVPDGAWERFGTRLEAAGAASAAPTQMSPTSSSRTSQRDTSAAGRTRWYVPVIAAASVVLLALGVTATVTGMFRTEEPGQAVADAAIPGTDEDSWVPGETSADGGTSLCFSGSSTLPRGSEEVVEAINAAVGTSVCFFDGYSRWTDVQVTDEAGSAGITPVLSFGDRGANLYIEKRYVYGSFAGQIHPDADFDNPRLTVFVDGVAYPQLRVVSGLLPGTPGMSSVFAVPIPTTGAVTVEFTDPHTGKERSWTLQDAAASPDASGNDTAGAYLGVFDPSASSAEQTDTVTGFVTSHNGCVEMVVSPGTPNQRVVTPVFPDGDVTATRYQELFNYRGTVYHDGDKVTVDGSFDSADAVLPERCSGDVLQVSSLSPADDGDVVVPDPDDSADPDDATDPDDTGDPDVSTTPDAPVASDPTPWEYPLCPNPELEGAPDELAGAGAGGESIAFYPSGGVCFFDGRSWWTEQVEQAYSTAVGMTDVIGDLPNLDGGDPAPGRYVYGLAFGDQQPTAEVDGAQYTPSFHQEHEAAQTDGHPNWMQFAIRVPATGAVTVHMANPNGNGPEDVTPPKLSANDTASANSANGAYLTTFDPASSATEPPMLVSGTLTSYNGCVAVVLDAGTPGARVVTPVFSDDEVTASSYPTLLTYDGHRYAAGDTISLAASTESVGRLPARCSTETLRVRPAGAADLNPPSNSAADPGTWSTDTEGTFSLGDNLLYDVAGSTWGDHGSGVDILTINLGPDSGDLGYEISYVPEIVQDGSGLPVTLAGSAQLQIRMGAAAVDPGDGTPTVDLSNPENLVDPTQYGAVQQVTFVGSFEGQTVLGLGLDEMRPFHTETSVNSWGDRVLTIWIAAD